MFSRYLPLSQKGASKPINRFGAPTTEREARSKRDRERSLRNFVENSTKRRSTMNSRAAYEEDEMLRKVLEESRADGIPVVSEGSFRKGKRGRDESDEYAVLFQAVGFPADVITSSRSDTKRLRTDSNSPIPTSKEGSPMSFSDLDGQRGHGRKKQAIRGAAARSQRDKELRDRENDRAEAAQKRKGRADRRRGEGTVSCILHSSLRR